MQRLRLYDCRNSSLPKVVGLCQGDIPAIADYVNRAQRRLLMCKEAGDEGWLGTFMEMAFTVTIDNPYITTPREVARLEKIATCFHPTPIQNQFYEYLDFGIGPQTNRCWQNFWPLQGYTRNNVVTFKDITAPPVFIRIYPTDASDVDSHFRVFLQGTDQNDVPINSLNGASTPPTQVQGIFVTLESPFAMSPMTFNALNGIQKDVTAGRVLFFQVDPNTGEETLIHTMEPSETTASYRRYFLRPLPTACCPVPTRQTNLPVTGIAKLDLIPVRVDTDYTLIQNLEAILQECQSIRYDAMDTVNAKILSANHHKAAIGLLNGELVHYLGKERPAVNFAPFGSAHLYRQRIGTLV